MTIETEKHMPQDALRNLDDCIAAYHNSDKSADELKTVFEAMLRELVDGCAGYYRDSPFKSQEDLRIQFEAQRAFEKIEFDRIFGKS